MATLTVTMAQFQEISTLRVGGVDVYAGPIVFEGAAGGTVGRALFVQDPRGHIFVFAAPRPTEAAFLAAFPGAVKIANIA